MIYAIKLARAAVKMKIGKNIINKCKREGAEIVGFGKSNIPLTDFLLSAGVRRITVRDSKDLEADASARYVIQKYRLRGVVFIFGKNYLDNLAGGVIFRTPGIRPDVAEFKKAVSKGALLTSEMELFFALCPAHMIGVTGSDGKTTTTTLIYKLLSECCTGSGKKIGLGGNIGVPLLPRAYELRSEDFAVTELSSFQLMTMTAAPATAVITNMSPNHLNWHRDMNEYRDAKVNIIGEGCRRAILNYNNEYTRAVAERTKAEVIWFTSRSVPDTLDNVVCIDDGEMVLRRKNIEISLLPLDKIKIPGTHNIENYMAAIAAVYDLVPYEALVPAASSLASTFSGVEHRLELVREFKRVKFYNGSIDSTPSRTAAALSALPGERISLICGGYDKNIPFAPLADAIAEHGGVVSVTLTGATAQKIKSAFDESGKSMPPYEIIDDFDDAVLHAANEAFELGAEAVPLSPACASFDRFSNFEERGSRFKQLINQIK